jgi:hypothetical protein
MLYNQSFNFWNIVNIDNKTWYIYLQDALILSKNQNEVLTPINHWKENKW